MSEQLKNTIIRFAFVFFAITAGFVGVIAKILYIQVAEQEKWDAIAQKQVKRVCAIQPIRGNIYDNDGRLLASSTPQYYIWMDTRVEALHLGGDTLFNRYIGAISEGLSDIIGDYSTEEYRSRIVQAKRAKRDFRITKTRINYLQKKQIQQLPLICRGIYKSGVHFEPINIRTKPYGTLGSRTVGSIYAADGTGNSGLEKRFEEFLHGKEGRAVRKKVAGRWTQIPTKNAVNGCDIVTTLDANLMDIVESSLRERLIATQADWGCCILMETKTGKIKAISNLDSDPDGNYYEKENHAVKRVEPGSTFKTISLMAVLDDGKMEIDDTIRVYRNGWKYFDSNHTDSHPKDTTYNLRSALAVSSNIAFAKMVTSSYEKKAEKFVSKLEKMGLTAGFDTEIPGTEKPRIDIPKDRVTLSKMAYGYSVELSPMQILAFYNGIANDGKMIRPYLVERVEREGETIEKYGTETLKSSLCKSSTLHQVQEALHDVVWDNDLGTASVLKWQSHIVRRKAQSDRVHIAGKTGTAQLLVKGRYQGQQHRITFVGYFPEENPQYTCICMINHPRNHPYYDAGGDCGSVVRTIAEKTIAYTGVWEWHNGEYTWKKVK